MFQLMGKKLITILCSKSFHIWTYDLILYYERVRGDFDRLPQQVLVLQNVPWYPISVSPDTADP